MVTKLGLLSKWTILFNDFHISLKMGIFWFEQIKRYYNNLNLVKFSNENRLQCKKFNTINGKTGYAYDEIGYWYPMPAEDNVISGFFECLAFSF